MRLRRTPFLLCVALVADPVTAHAQRDHAENHRNHGAPDSSAQLLRSMTVTADRERVVLRSGRTIVDPRAIAASQGSIADLLRAIPGVEIDANGNVSMRGNAHALVLINGRRTALSGAALIAWLRQMPAQDLERVEAATAPSAKQDANGAAGVLNLVFRDAEDAEHTTPLRSVSGTFASRDDFMASAAATGHAGHLVHWDAALASSASRPRATVRSSRWTVLSGELPFTTEEDARSVVTHRLHSVHAGAAVTPTPATSFGLRGTYSRMEGAESTRRSAFYANEAGNTATSATTSVVEHDMPTGELIATMRVEGGRARFASELRGSLVRADFRGDFDDLDGGFRYLSAAMESRQREHVMRNDLRVRWPGVDLELGHESRWRRATAVHGADHLGAVETRTLRHRSAVHAAYASAERRAGAFRGEAGVRVEGDRDLVALESVQVRRSIRVFPSVDAEWMDAARGMVYRAAYGRRLTRPTWEMLNPLAMGDDGSGEVVGNTALRAEVMDQVELGVERQGERMVLHVTPFVRWSRDAIREVSTPAPRGGTRSLVNVDRASWAGADVGLRARATDRLEVSLAGTVASVETMRRPSDRRSEGVHTSIRAALDLRVSASSTAQLLVAGRSRRTLAQGGAAPGATTQFALKRSVAGGRGHVTLQLSDPRRVDSHSLREPGLFRDRMERSTRRPTVGIVGAFALGGMARDASARVH